MFDNLLLTALVNVIGQFGVLKQKHQYLLIVPYATATLVPTRDFQHYKDILDHIFPMSLNS